MVCLYRPWGLFAAVMDGSALQPSGAGRKGLFLFASSQQRHVWKLKKTCQQRQRKPWPEFCVVLTYFPKLEYVHKWVKCNFKVAKYISVLPNNYCLILSTELPNSLQPTL